MQCKRCQRFGHTQQNCGYTPQCVVGVDPHLSGDCPTPRGQPWCCSCRGDHTANYQGCAKWKEVRAALAKQAPEQGRKIIAVSKPAAPKAKQAGPSAEQMDLGEGWSHVIRGGQIVKASTPSSTPKTIPKPVTEAPKQPQVTATSKKVKPEKVEPKTTAAPKMATVKPKKVATTSSKPVVAIQLVANPHPTTSPLKGISDLDNLPLEACVELTRQLLTSISSLPKGAGRPQNHNPLCGRIWQHALGRIGVKPCVLPAGMRTVCAAGSSSWRTFSANKASIYVS
jgi:hypothetical protein